MSSYFFLCLFSLFCSFFFFFFNDPATTEIYTLSLHDALPICPAGAGSSRRAASSDRAWCSASDGRRARSRTSDRKSTRLNSSHEWISYAVFCLKKKKTNKNPSTQHVDTDRELVIQ